MRHVHFNPARTSPQQKTFCLISNNTQLRVSRVDMCSGSIQRKGFSIADGFARRARTWKAGLPKRTVVAPGQRHSAACRQCASVTMSRLAHATDLKSTRKAHILPQLDASNICCKNMAASEKATTIAVPELGTKYEMQHMRTYAYDHTS